MKTTLRTALLLLAIAAARAPFAAEIERPRDPIPGRYIVVLNDEPGAEDATRREARIRATAEDMARRHGGRTSHIYSRALRGYAIELSEAQAQVLARDPRVRSIEQDGRVSIRATQSPPPSWGLDRIDQRNLPLDNAFTYNTSGAGVHAYVIDTGIRSTHVEFAGRIGTGVSFVSGDASVEDCNGHGTHTSGTIGGATYGIAKSVTLHPVRVLNCTGSGTNSATIAGVDWVTANHVKPAVANMSLGGSVSSALNQAVTNSIAAGVSYAVAAGNSNGDACNASPASVPNALTVAASDATDRKASFSNYGSCVDVFAPGVGIVSAYNSSDTAQATLSGTSMAAPHVAGVVALYLERNPAATPAQVAQAVRDGATATKVTGAPAGTTTALLYSDLAAAAPPAGSGIRVSSATYGASCGVAEGTHTSVVAGQCNGQTSCGYVVDYLKIGDPAPGCAKDFKVSYACGSDPTQRNVTVPPEAGFGSVAALDCGAAPPPPPSTSTISVLAATYGANCGVPAGSHTGVLQLACDGKSGCNYRIDYTVIGDPAPGCAKDFTTQYRCSGSGTTKSAFAPPEAGFGSILALACP